MLISPAVASSASHCLTHERRQKKLRHHSSFFPVVRLARVCGQIHAQHKAFRGCGKRVSTTSCSARSTWLPHGASSHRRRWCQSGWSTLRSRANWSRRYIQHGINFSAVMMPRLSIARRIRIGAFLFPAIKSLDEGRASAICLNSGGEQKFARLLPEPERKRSGRRRATE